MSRLTYWLMRDWDEYVGAVASALRPVEQPAPDAVLAALLQVARASALGVTSGEDALPRQMETTPWPQIAGRAVLLAGLDKQLPTVVWDRAQLMLTLAWMSLPVVLVVTEAVLTES